MYNLLSTDFARLWKNKSFWSCFIAGILICLVTVFGDYHSLELYQEPKPLDEVFFCNVPLMGLISAIFVSLFWGLILVMEPFGIRLAQDIRERRYTFLDGWSVYRESL